MATSTCVKCGSTNFEQKAGQDWLVFIQCSNCGGVVGVIDGATNRKMERKLEEIEHRVRNI